MRATITSAPIERFSSSGVPFGDELPVVDDADAVRELVGLLEVLRREEDRHAEVGRSSRRTSSHTRARLTGSSPVVGSSRNTISGLCTSAAARSSRRRMPPEYVPI